MHIVNVATQIEVAFADTPSPGSEFSDISVTQVDEGIIEYFRGRDWRDHRVQDLRRHEAALSFFTDKAFRYWLPAFMLAELEDPIEADVIGEGIVFHLTEGADSDTRLRQFAEDELEAIACFFDVCANRFDDDDYREASRVVRERRQKA